MGRIRGQVAQRGEAGGAVPVAQGEPAGGTGQEHTGTEGLVPVMGQTPRTVAAGHAVAGPHPLGPGGVGDAIGPGDMSSRTPEPRAGGTA